jgi:hypothetical protein
MTLNPDAVRGVTPGRNLVGLANGQFVIDDCLLIDTD